MRAMGWMALVLVTGFAVNTAMAADPTGTWKWSMTTQNGEKRETTLKLKVADGKLEGTISGRQGADTPITDGKIDGDTISFKVVREFNGNKMEMVYKGKVDAETIKGTIESERDGQKRTRDWEAKKAK